MSTDKPSPRRRPRLLRRDPLWDVILILLIVALLAVAGAVLRTAPPIDAPPAPQPVTDPARTA